MLRIEIQNENLAAFEDGRVIACVPDLISLVDETGHAVPTELLRFGQRVDRDRHALRPAVAHAARAGDRRAGRVRLHRHRLRARGGEPCRLDLRIGIDVGGTHTDAVLLNTAHHVLAKVKVPTTADVTSGVRAALDGVLAGQEAQTAAPGDPRDGRHHARHERHPRAPAAARVAVLRLAAPSGLAIRPLLAWPDDLRDAVLAGAAIVGGGHELDGREIAPLDEDAIRRFLAAHRRRGGGHLRRVLARRARPRAARPRPGARGAGRRHARHAGPRDRRARADRARERRRCSTPRSARCAQAAAHGVQAAVAAHGLDARLFFTQNDGTLMSVEQAARTPVLTIGSGLANSMRGAAFLSRLRDALVIDVGGTSSDVAALDHGFPRESATAIDIGGARTNFRMPDIVSIGLGGGSIVRDGSAAEGRPAERRRGAAPARAGVRRRHHHADRCRRGRGPGADRPPRAAGRAGRPRGSSTWPAPCSRAPSTGRARPSPTCRWWPSAARRSSSRTRCRA